MLRRFGVHEDSPVHGFMMRHGVRAVAAGRLFAGIRTKLAIVSGSTRLPVPPLPAGGRPGRRCVGDPVGAARLPVLELGATLIDRFGSASHVLGVIAIVVGRALVVYLSVRYVLRFRPAAA